MKKYQCDCCGGQIDPKTLTCEYCGMQYKEEFKQIIKVETFENPVRTYRSQYIIPKELIDMNLPLEEISRIATENIIHSLAECLADNIVIKHHYSPHLFENIITGTVKIVHPADISTRW